MITDTDANEALVALFFPLFLFSFVMSPSNDSDAQTLPVRKLGIQSQSWNTQSDLNSSRQALQTEIYGKIIRNDANVFRRLRVHDVSDAFVDACAACLCEDNAAAIAKLKELERNATVTRKADNDGTGRKETEMYGPIVCIHPFFLLRIVAQSLVLLCSARFWTTSGTSKSRLMTRQTYPRPPSRQNLVSF